MKFPTKIPASELKLADTIRCFDGEWSTGIVKQIKDGMITIFRPYGITADFSYTGGVICYTGVEDYQIPVNDHEIEVLSRKDLQ